MMGHVSFLLWGEPATAILDDEGRWRSPERAVTEALQLTCGLDQFSPADGYPPGCALAAGAELLGGTYEAEPPPDEPPGVVY
jgi:hypothetical protein